MFLQILPGSWKLYGKTGSGHDDARQSQGCLPGCRIQ